MPLYVPALSDVSTISVAWVDPSGVERSLNTGSIDVVGGATGLGAPPAEPSVDKFPLSPGGRLRRVQRTPARISLPIYVRGSSESSLTALIDNLRYWFDPGNEATAQTGTLKVTRADGTVRARDCVYESGLEGAAEAVGGAGLYVVRLLAADPYWRDADDTTITFAAGAQVAALFPFFPLVLSASGTYSQQSVLNSGQAEAYPVWTITGPGSEIVLSNLTTGRTLTINHTLTSGETLTVDTRPVPPNPYRVRDAYGNSLFRSVEPPYDFWPLAVGANVVSVSMAGTSGVSAFSFDYAAAYLGALA